MNVLLKRLGPGLLYAGAAVGISHLVQSTKAGSNFGFQLLIFVILANIIKYPFFEFAPRYTLIHKESIIEGYRKLGKWAVYLFLSLTVLTMFTIQAAITLVTSALFCKLFNINIENISIVSLIILIICIAIIFIGRYKTLDKIMKLIIILLSLSTITAVIFATNKTSYFESNYINEFVFEGEHLTFFIALIGWMPAPIDISVWQSIWNLEKIKANPNTSLKDALFDFKVGYWSTTVLAVLFLALGAFTLYGSNVNLELKEPAGAFTSKLINMYTNTIGDFSYYIISIAALTTMFSTTLTCFDAFPRTLSPTLQILRDKQTDEVTASQRLFWLGLIGTGAFIIITMVRDQLGFMINIATILSFLTAPILAFLNYKIIYSDITPAAFRPKKHIQYLSWLGISFLSLLSIWFILNLIQA